MGGTVNLTSFVPPTEVISLSHFLSFYWKSWNIIVEFLFCYLSKWGCKNIFVVLSHSLLFKLTQLWRFPLLRNPEMWKGSLETHVIVVMWWIWPIVKQLCCHQCSCSLSGETAPAEWADRSLMPHLTYPFSTKAVPVLVRSQSLVSSQVKSPLFI